MKSTCIRSFLRFRSILLSLLVLVTIVTTSVAFASTGLSKSDFTALGTMEQNILSARYEKETLEDRLNRLELVVYGETFTAKSPQERLTSLGNILSGLKPATQQSPAPDNSNNNNSNTQPTPVYMPPATSSGNGPGEDMYPALSVIENRVFGKSYETEDIQKRLGRVEQQVFGTPQQGTLMARVDSLRFTVLGDVRTSAPQDNYQQTYQQPYQQPYPQAQPDFSQASPYAPPMGDPNSQGPAFYNPNNSAMASPDMDNALSKVEKNILKKTYPMDNVGQRLDRLEMAIFHQTSPPQVPDDERFQRIVTVAAADGDDPRPGGRGSFIKTMIPILIMMLPLLL